jgi:hypothetical protein
MPTPYENIYARFIRKITDYGHENLLEEDLAEILLGYLQSAVPKFVQSKTDLSRNDSTEKFSNTLSELEEEIISQMMVNEWLQPKVKTTDLLEEKLSPKDFSSFSPANQVKELRELYLDSQKEVDSLIVTYTYNSDLSNLS